MKRLIVSLSIILLLATGCVYVPSIPGTGGQAPVINSFEANPETINAGSRAQLSWSVSDARSVTIDNGIGSVALRGSRTVLPASTTIFTITATNQYGSVSATAQVVVSGTTPPSYSYPVINSFSGSPGSIVAGASAVLSWNISNATTASIDPGIGNVSPTSGSQYVSPSSTTTYILTATNASGSVTYPVTLSVSGLPPVGSIPVVNYFQASPEIVSSGSSTTLSWNVTNASQVTIVSGGGSILMVPGSGSVATTPAATQTYTLQATNSSGMVSKTITVAVSSGGGADVTAPGIPTLLTPAAGATLPQPSSAWSFDWSDSADAESGIQQYEIYVIRSGAGSPAINAYSNTSSYSTVVGGAIGAAYLDNWTWKVRTQNNAGIWSDWTAIRTFSVVAPAVVSHTLVLSPVAAETGAVYKDGTVAVGTKFAGDTGTNVAIRSYFSYDISALAGKEVTNAKLNFASSTVRDPFGHLGGLWIGQVIYGTGPLQASDYNLGSSPFAGSFVTAPAEVNVTTAVKNSALASNSRFQVRAHYASETNSDNLADYLNFTGATLTVTYND